MRKESTRSPINTGTEDTTSCTALRGVIAEGKTTKTNDIIDKTQTWIKIPDGGIPREPLHRLETDTTTPRATKMTIRESAEVQHHDTTTATTAGYLPPLPKSARKLTDGCSADETTSLHPPTPATQHPTPPPAQQQQATRSRHTPAAIGTPQPHDRAHAAAAATDPTRALAQGLDPTTPTTATTVAASKRRSKSN